jgi:hypothetical protein
MFSVISATVRHALAEVNLRRDVDCSNVVSYDRRPAEER